MELRGITYGESTGPLVVAHKLEKDAKSIECCRQAVSTSPVAPEMKFDTLSVGSTKKAF